MRWHLWEIDLIFASGLPPGWLSSEKGTNERGVSLLVEGIQVCPGRDQLPHTLCAFGAQDSETTLGQIDSFYRQLPYKCHLEEMASVED